MSVSQNFPNIVPSLSLNFAQVKALDPRITFSRASTATYYDGKTVAKAEENLLLRSQEFDQAAWGKSNSTVTANTETAPDGTVTADTFTATSNNAVLSQAVTYGASAPATFSIYVKRKTGTGDVSISHTIFGSTTPITVTSDWQRFSVTSTVASGTVGIKLATSGDEIYVWAAQAEARDQATAYTPTTTQPITNYIPVLQTAAANVARFDHNPVTRESLGLLVEEQRTNLLTYSEDFANAAWAKTSATITADTIVAPDGTLTGDKLVEDTATASRFVRQGATVTSGATSTFSVFIKSAERNAILVTLDDGSSTNQVRCAVNLATATVGAVTFVGAGANGVASIQSVGNNWYRVILTGTPSGSATTHRGTVFIQNPAGTSSYTGDGYSGIYIWGAQLEAGAFPTSYISTSASQATRSADSASMTGTNFSSWYRQDEGTFYADFRTSATGVSRFAMTAAGVTTGDRYIVAINLLNTINPAIVYSASTRVSFDLGSYSTGTDLKVSLGYKVGDYAASDNGQTVVTNTAGGAMPVLTNLTIGNLASAFHLNGTIKKLAFYPQRISNAQLQALTTP